jgi:hypothetical protein
MQVSVARARALPNATSVFRRILQSLSMARDAATQVATEGAGVEGILARRSGRCGGATFTTPA